ncbi:prohead protease/major capsid protein fusion protein [Paracoccus chinensis]|uniref:Prohead serine protease n=1 Tax=Paracoccus chinensis TaxID=525640 RepID=A0A1G9JIP7_9RHOB|nr:prohead protease/major capsid protein fusion protein [Paracoccus chinensis]SDL36984.1 prohead serine protease [Paracoccus chinensis]
MADKNGRQIAVPMMARAAEVQIEATNAEERTIDVVWTTGATVQRARWDGWDDRVEYDEELIVSGNAVRLDRLNAGGPFLDSHDGYSLRSVLGSVVPGSVRIVGGQGHATVRLTDAEDVASQVRKILDKSIRFVSVGYRVHRYDIEKRDGQREIWRAVDWEPYEISAVPMPADAGAVIRSEKGSAPQTFPCVVTRHDVPAAPAARGLETTMKDDPKAVAEHDTRAAGNDDKKETPVTDDKGRERPAGTPEGAPPLTDKQRAELLAAERQRSAGIMGLCARAGMADKAESYIERGATLDQVRAELFDALTERSDGYGRKQEQAPAMARGTGERAEQFRGAVGEAIMHRINPRTQLNDAAREFRGMRMAEIAKLCLERSGIDARGLYPHEIITQALSARSGVGYHTTSDFALIVGNVMNRTLRQAYEETPRTFTAWARRTTMRDFRAVTRLRGWEAPDLLKVNEAAEFQYGTISGAGETMALATYGRIIAFTRQLLVNDDMDALGRMPERFGVAAADLESDIVYGVLLANPVMSDGKALFHADHGNIGSAAIISDASITAAMQAFATGKNSQGRSIGFRPKYIIVPPGPREMEARRLLTAVTPGRAADVNIYADSGLEIVVEPRLIPASGQHPWFLAADPARVDTIDYAFLEGQEGVFTETRAGFEVDGVETKARHDFGAGAMDWRGLYKNTGAAPA